MREPFFHYSKPEYKEEGWFRHIWFGRLGFHFYLPDFWKSRLDWYNES